MAWYADLAECDYFRTWHSSFIRAVGWLERGRSYTRGTVDLQVFNELTELRRDAWQPCLFMGSHGCDLCLSEGEKGHTTCSFQVMDSFLSAQSESSITSRGTSILHRRVLRGGLGLSTNELYSLCEGR